MSNGNMLAVRLTQVFLLGFPLFATQDPMPEFEKLLQTGRAATAKGDYTGALKLFERAWKLVEQAELQDPKRYHVLKQLSATHAALGQYQEAEGYMQLAINWREVAVSRNDPKLADEFIELIAILRGRKEFDRALAVANQVRMMHFMHAGMKPSALVAEDHHRSAQIYLDLEQPDAAAAEYSRALQILEQLYDPDHPALLTTLDRFAETRIVVRDYPGAEDAFIRALRIRERIVGRAHADLLSTLDGLAYSLFGQSKYEEAEVVYKRLLALWEATSGREHPMVAMTLDKIAVFYREQQKWDEAQAAVNRATAVRAHFLASGLIEEARHNVIRQKSEEAKALYAKALAVIEQAPEELKALREAVEKEQKIFLVAEKPAPPPGARRVPPASLKKQAPKK